ncbi:MAG: TRAM domain-containing protein [Halobacteriales archaeon]|nr:TRAM domain-containing protein [Halobacteriales archaeon]
MEISGKLLCLVSSRVERRNGSYVVEIPESEIEEGDLSEGDVYRVGILGDEMKKKSKQGSEGGTQLQPPVEEGEIRYVEIEDLGKQGDGIARVERGYVIIVPDAEVGDRVKVEVDEVKENFAVGEVLEEDAFE